MNSICWFCLRDLEVYDGVYLCHPCHNIFGDVNSPFYYPTLLMQETWKEAMSDPNATMWLQQRIKENQ
mgnify:CR=1 FL=1